MAKHEEVINVLNTSVEGGIGWIQGSCKNTCKLSMRPSMVNDPKPNPHLGGNKIISVHIGERRAYQCLAAKPTERYPQGG